MERSTDVSLEYTDLSLGLDPVVYDDAFKYQPFWGWGFEPSYQGVDTSSVGPSIPYLRPDDGNLGVESTRLLWYESTSPSTSPTCSTCESQSAAGEEDPVRASSSSNMEIQNRKRPISNDLDAKDSKRRQRIPCSYSECTQKFTKAADRDRHVRNIHEDIRFLCGCCSNHGARTNRCRLDKINEHMRKAHGLLKLKGSISCEDTDCKELVFPFRVCLDWHLRCVHKIDPPMSTNLAGPCQDASSSTTCLCMEQTIHKTSDSAGSTSFQLIPRSHGCSEPSANMSASSAPSANSFSVHPQNLFSCPNTPGSPTTSVVHIGRATLEDYMVHVPARVGAQTVSAYQGKILKDNSSISLSDVTEEPFPGVQAADFVALRVSKLLAHIQSSLTSNLDHMRIRNFHCISYNVGNRSLILRGSKTGMSRATELLKTHFKNVSKSQVHEILSNPAVENSRKATVRTLYDSSRPACKAVKHYNNDGESRLFPISAQDFPYEFDIWKKILGPELPRTLDEVIGNEYSMSLVLFGQKMLDAEPSIQIETPVTLGKETKESIFERIKSICAHHNCQFIPLVFTTGVLVRLATPKLPKYTSFDGEDNGRYQFSYHSPWEKPGMGIAVGMKCSDNISGTLGGYLQIDQKLYLLTAAHVVEDAWDALRQEAAPSDRKELVLPPKDILDNLKQWVEYQHRENNAQIKRQLEDMAKEKHTTYGNEEIVPEDLDSHSTMKQGRVVMENVDSLKQFSEAVQQSPKTIGQFVKMGTECVESGVLRRLYPNDTNGQGQTQMDWAIHKAYVEGTNRHRYRSADDALAATKFPRSVPDRPIPEGLECEETCDPGDNAVAVHYVGRTSGHRQCTLNGAPMFYRGREGSLTRAFFLIDPGKRIQKEEVEGDSGAWIIRKSDNRLLGQLFGLQNDKLVFTPINDIIDHIKTVSGTEDVCLPRRSHAQSSEPTPEPITLSYKRSSFKVVEHEEDELVIPPVTPDSPHTTTSITPPLSPAMSNSDTSISGSVGPSTPSPIVSPGSYEDVRVDESGCDDPRSYPYDRIRSEPLYQLIQAEQSVQNDPVALKTERTISKDMPTSKKGTKHDLSYILDNISERRQSDTLPLPQSSASALFVVKNNLLRGNKESPAKSLWPELGVGLDVLKRRLSGLEKIMDTQKPSRLLKAPMRLQNDPTKASVPRVQTW